MGVNKLLKSLQPYLPKDIGLFFSVGIASTWIANYLAENLLFNAVCGIAAGWIIDAYIASRFSIAASIKETDKDLRHTHQGSELTDQYYQIASKRFSKELEAEIKNLQQASHEFQGELLPKNIELAKLWKSKVEDHERWRILMQILLCSEINSLKANDFSMPLNTYLRILLTTIDFATSIAIAKNKKLVIASFTNACPADWFRVNNPVVGGSMEKYSDELAQRIDLMRTRGFRYCRYILCSDTLENRGFKSKSKVEENWLCCETREKLKYLNQLHTSEDEAFILELYPEIKFLGRFTELIYFGFEDDTSITWDWCYECAYTNDNTNVSAKYVNLANEGPELLIKVDNSRNRPIGDSMATPPEIKIQIGFFPKMFSDVGIKYKIKDLVTLANKWHIAAQIWHDDNEEKLFSSFFTSLFPDKGKTRILDCACGTGFHSFLLRRNGFNVIATDADSQNIEILKEVQVKTKTFFQAKVANWLNLNREFKDEKFDCVACLGSSITYFESWNETMLRLSYISSIDDVLDQFHGLLRDNGKLVLGISRHYDKNISGTSILFNKKTIDGHCYSMEWILRYDWKEMYKTWECKINEKPSGSDYSFFLVSHLIDKNDLEKICKRKFAKVEFVDIDSSFYDIFLLCTK